MTNATEPASDWPDSPSADLDASAEFAAEQERRQWLVSDAACHGQRLDRVLVQAAPEFSRSYLQQILSAGGVSLNGQIVTKAAAKVRLGDALAIVLQATPQSQSFRPEPIALDIVFEDEHVLVLNKAAGLVVHPAPGNWSGTVLNALLAHHAAAATLPRAGIVHRLDKDTSGLMVVAKTRAAMDALVAQLAARTVSRQYLAIAHGAWTHSRVCVPGEALLEVPPATVSAPIGRDPRHRLRMCAFAAQEPLPTGVRTARTDIRLLANAAAHCLVHCKLHTGRTHQIRVHMRHLGHPLVGDALYALRTPATPEPIARQALHAWQLSFVHPASAQTLYFQAAPSADFQNAAQVLGLHLPQM